MYLALLCAAILASTLALELYPGGAIVPEETREVAEAREWLEAAQEAAREEDVLSRGAALEDKDGERQYRGCRGCFPLKFCCSRRSCRLRRMCGGWIP